MEVSNRVVKGGRLKIMRWSPVIGANVCERIMDMWQHLVGQFYEWRIVHTLMCVSGQILKVRIATWHYLVE